jgi:hypothetical protein
MNELLSLSLFGAKNDSLDGMQNHGTTTRARKRVSRKQIYQHEVFFQKGCLGPARRVLQF